MRTRARVALVGVGNEFRWDDGAGRAAVARGREKTVDRLLPSGTVLATCDGGPARLICRREGTDFAADTAHAHPGHPGRIHRIELVCVLLTGLRIRRQR